MLAASSRPLDFACNPAQHGWVMEPQYVYASKYYKIVVLLVVVLPMLGVLAAIVLLWNQYVFPLDIALLLSMYAITALGITIGYHRMLTHTSFETSAPVKALFLIFGCMGFEGGPLLWAATHTYHHAHSDEEGDPHSPLDGFWHAHLGWVFRNRFQDPKVYVPHLAADPLIVWVERTAILWPALSLAIPFIIGGWTGLLWGGLVRMFMTSHITWSVNSVCHTFGKRAFETSDESRNNWIIGLLGFGEGWHNNHHAFPRNAFHGMHWWQFDMSGLLIRVLEKLGLVWNVQRVSREAEEAQKLRAARTVSAMQALREQVSLSIEAADTEFQKLMGRTIEGIDQEALYKQLQEIRAAVSSPLHLKRPRLEGYAKQAQELVTRIRSAIPNTQSA